MLLRPRIIQFDWQFIRQPKLFRFGLLLKRSLVARSLEFPLLIVGTRLNIYWLVYIHGAYLQNIGSTEPVINNPVLTVASLQVQLKVGEI